MIAETYSKSAHDRMYVVSAMPIAPKANPMSTQIGSDSTTHGEPVMPSAHIVTRKAIE